MCVSLKRLRIRSLKWRNLGNTAKRLCFESFNNDNGERLKTAVSLVLWKVFEKSGAN